MLLAHNVGTLIIDHHLLRAEKGLKWLRSIALKSNNRVICVAEFMGQAPLLLEAWREECYQSMPISQDWHKAYRKGETNLHTYVENGWEMLVKKWKTHAN